MRSISDRSRIELTSGVLLYSGDNETAGPETAPPFYCLYLAGGDGRSPQSAGWRRRLEQEPDPLFGPSIHPSMSAAVPIVVPFAHAMHSRRRRSASPHVASRMLCQHGRLGVYVVGVRCRRLSLQPADNGLIERSVVPPTLRARSAHVVDHRQQLAVPVVEHQVVARSEVRARHVLDRWRVSLVFR